MKKIEDALAPFSNHLSLNTRLISSITVTSLGCGTDGPTGTGAPPGGVIES